MENTPIKKRMMSQDIAKGFCILGIIASHTLALPPIGTQIISALFGLGLSFFLLYLDIIIMVKSAPMGKLFGKDLNSYLFHFYMY